MWQEDLKHGNARLNIDKRNRHRKTVNDKYR